MTKPNSQITIFRLLNNILINTMGSIKTEENIKNTVNAVNGPSKKISPTKSATI